MQRFDNSQTDLFSLHKSAELKNYSLEEIENKFDELELAMLTDFFDFAKINNEKYWIHWNMRDSNYGFKALEHRYRVLSGNQPSTFVPDNKKIDLARLFKIRFTSKYAKHPRIPNLIEMNDIKAKDLLSGADEAETFVNKDFIKLSFSTAAKVDAFSELLTLAIDNRLKTNTTKKELYGTSLQGYYHRFMSTKMGFLVRHVISIIIGAIIGYYVTKFLGG